MHVRSQIRGRYRYGATHVTIEDLVRKQYAETAIEQAFIAMKLPRIFDGMFELTESSALQRHFPWSVYRADGYGAQYEQEIGIDHNERNGENKYQFQFARTAYANKLACRGLLDALGDLELRAQQLTLSLAFLIDDHFQGTCTERPYQHSAWERLSDATYITRVLRYLPNGAGSADAHPHRDRSFLTIHWGASHEGLWVYDAGGNRSRVHECTRDAILIMLGRKYAAMMGNARLGCPHGVRYPRVIGDDRFSVVTFVHPRVLPCDAEWLESHDADIKKYEQSLVL